MKDSFFLFALDPLKGALVEPSEVLRGKECACICPSCKIPVIARKGEINRWHFAHDSKEFAAAVNECDYNLLLSVRLMARQILSEEVDLSLPAYQARVSEQLSARALSVPYEVTAAKTVRLKDPKINYKVGTEVVDVYCDFGKHKLLIYLTHAGRALPKAVQTLARAPYGLICINLGWINALVEHESVHETSYRDLLRERLLNGLEYKQWVYHPKQIEAKAAALKELQRKVRDYKRSFGRNGHTTISDARIDEIVAPKK